MPVRNPRRSTLFGRVIGEQSHIRAVGTHDGDLSVRLKCPGQNEPDGFILESLPRRREGDPVAVRREGRMRVVA